MEGPAHRRPYILVTQDAVTLDKGFQAAPANREPTGVRTAYMAAGAPGDTRGMPQGA